MEQDTGIAVIGSGMIGSAVARLAVRAGRRVVLANSRGPASLTPLVEALGPLASAATAQQAARGSAVVVLALPMAACLTLPPDLLADRVAVDAANHYPERSGPLPELDAAQVPSSVFLQARWPRTHVVKALNAMDYVRLEQLAAAPGGVRTAVPVAADDAGARAAVDALVHDLGFDPLDAGPLAGSWRFEPGTPLHVRAYLRPLDEADPETDPLRRFERATPVPLDASRTVELLAAARKV